jgi:hypothetical protein
MDDMTAFERQLSDQIGALMGPPRPVDDLAVFDAVVARSQKRVPRWTLRRFGRRARPAPIIPDLDTQRTRIPTTIIWRTDAMLSPVKTLTAGALVFAIGGMLLIAQPFGRQEETVPSAAGDAEPAWAAVTGTSSCGPGTPGVTQQDGPPYSLTNRIGRCQDTSTDPRVSGPSTIVINAEGWDSTEGHNAVAWFEYSIEGPDGTWAGHTYGLYDDSGDLDLVGILAGDGAYEGLTFTVTGTIPNNSSILTYDGLIQPGTLPPGFPTATFREPLDQAVAASD